MFPRHNGIALISECFALNLWISVPLTNKQLFAAVNVVSSDPCVGHSPKIKIYFFLFSTYTGELISTQKSFTFLPIPLATEKDLRLPNPIPYPEYLCLSISKFFTNLSAPKK